MELIIHMIDVFPDVGINGESRSITKLKLE